ncbi:MAG: hypothetical protein Q9215_006671 [Flavoplaca cf. flavocitrina]
MAASSTAIITDWKSFKDPDVVFRIRAATRFHRVESACMHTFGSHDNIIVESWRFKQQAQVQE